MVRLLLFYELEIKTVYSFISWKVRYFHWKCERNRKHLKPLSNLSKNKFWICLDSQNTAHREYNILYSLWASPLLRKSELLYIRDKISYNDIKYYFAFLQKDRESGVWRMKVLLSNVSRKNGYMIIDVFFSVLSGMNYPVLAHDDTMLKFIDVDEKFKKTEIRYDFRTRKIIMG